MNIIYFLQHKHITSCLGRQESIFSQPKQAQCRQALQADSLQKFLISKSALLKSCRIASSALCLTMCSSLAYAGHNVESEKELEHHSGKTPTSKSKKKIVARESNVSPSLKSYQKGLKFLSQGEYAEARRLFEKSTKKGSTPALYELGRMFNEGLGGEQSYQEARNLFMQAAERQDADAIYCLGVLYQNGWGVEESLEEAFKYYRQAAMEGHTEALYICGVAQHEEGCISEATASIAKAAQAGHKEARSYLEMLAEREPQAMFELGLFYEKSRGTSQFAEIASEWYKKAAAKKYSPAFYHLGLLHESGQLQIDLCTKIARYLLGWPPLEIDFFKEAADQGYDLAKRKLGWKYAYGKGVNQANEEAIKYLKDFVDEEETLEWIKRQAKQGDAKAQYILAGVFEKKEKYSKSAKFYEKSARQKRPEAQYALAQLYEHGHVGEFSSLCDRQKAYEKASEWYRKAARLGYERAEDAQESVQEKLNELHLFQQESKAAVSQTKNRLFLKLEASLQRDSKSWSQDFYNGAAFFTNILCLNYSEEVQQMGLYVLKELSGFPPHSRQFSVLMDSLLRLTELEEFKKSDDEEQVKFLEQIGRAVHLTIKPRPLHHPTRMCEHLEVAENMIEDPRVKVFNYFFEQDHKPYDRRKLDRAIDNLLKLFVQANLGSRDERLYDEEFRQYGTKEDLRALLINKGKNITNRFGHRIIKVADIILNKLDRDMAITQLASWAAAGIHCKTRSEGETYKFYMQHISAGTSLEGEDSTLESIVAKCLANLRKSLLDELVPASENERLHQIGHLEKKAARLLGLLGDAEKYEDPYEMIVKSKYKKLTPEEIRGAVLKEYTPEKMVSFIKEEINKGVVSLIPYTKIMERLEVQAKNSGASESPTIEDFFNDEGFVTDEGVRALLYSLGYLKEESEKES